MNEQEYALWVLKDLYTQLIQAAAIYAVPIIAYWTVVG
jgi:hypothetical protein